MLAYNVHRGLAIVPHAPFPQNRVVGIAPERPQVKMGCNTREQVGCESSGANFSMARNCQNLPRGLKLDRETAIHRIVPCSFVSLRDSA